MKNLLVSVSLLWLSAGAIAQNAPIANSKTLEEMGADIRAQERQRIEDPAGYQAKIETGAREYIRCAGDAAVYLDDMISDVATIAVGIKSYCGAQLDTLTRVSGTPRAGWETTLYPHVVKTVLARRVKMHTAAKRS